MSNVAINNNEIPFGTIIDSRYLIQKVLGQGGLGRTYLAFDTHRFNEPCVLKEFAPLGSGQYDLEKSRDLFKREAKILHQITHPQIPKFLACFEGKGRLFLVQEYVRGQTYSQLLQKRQQQGQVFSETEIIRWLMNMLPILTYIHQRGIIHRDISPDNIMHPQGEELPVLIDFGVGKLTNLPYGDEDNPYSTHSHSFVGKMSFVGKIGYAPREQISMGRCSPSSDIYALGVTAIVLLTGKMPTLLLDQYTLDWQWRKYAQTDGDLAQIIDKMIEDRPLKRYQSAQEVITGLQKLGQSQEGILNPELTSITDAHFYQKIALFSGEVINRKTTSPQENIVSSAEEETIINSAVGRKTTSHPQDSNPQFVSTGSQQEETQWIQPAPKNVDRHAQQIPSPPSPEDTIIIHSVGSSEPKGKLRPQQVQNPSTSFRQSSQSSSRYPEPSNRLSVKPTNPFGGTSNIQRRSLETRFIKRCQQELAYFIGPMASVIIDEILVQYATSSPEELVEALAEQIPDTQKAIKFKRKLLS